MAVEATVVAAWEEEVLIHFHVHVKLQSSNIV